jgi:hypothetical protein
MTNPRDIKPAVNLDAHAEKYREADEKHDETDPKFSARVAAVVGGRGVGVDEICAATAVSPATAYRKLTGEIPFTVVELAEIAAMLGVTVSEILRAAETADVSTGVNAEIAAMWAAAEAVAERRGVTEPTRPLIPNCPSWCDCSHRVGDLDFELHRDDSLRRSHCSRVVLVEEHPNADGGKPGVVELWASVDEFLDGSLTRGVVKLDVAGYPDLTPDQARAVARHLLAVADMAEAVTR